MSFQPQNILIIDFGQLGDVILSLPALNAVRKKFPISKITVMVGKTGADIVEMTGLCDEKIVVDRVKLLRSSKIWAISQIFKIVGDVRRRKFDFVIDLHSLYETNLLGFLSGSKHRLYANRENRSLDFLSNFRPRPPLEDRKSHLTEYYLSVLKPLGIKNTKKFFQIIPNNSDIETIDNLLPLQNVQTMQLVGLFPGAGHPARRWGTEKFVELAKKLSQDKNVRIIVFLGPEEIDLQKEVEEKFSKDVTILNKLKLPQVAAAFSRLSVLIGNDTGPVHLGAVVGTPIVLISDIRAPAVFLPLTEKLSIMRSGTIEEITVEEVFQAAQEFLTAESISNAST